MSFHSNFEQWLAMTERQNCPICQQLPMPEGMVDIVELPNSWLNTEPVECLRGACHLTAEEFKAFVNKMRKVIAENSR